MSHNNEKRRLSVAPTPSSSKRARLVSEDSQISSPVLFNLRQSLSSDESSAPPTVTTRRTPDDDVSLTPYSRHPPIPSDPVPVNELPPALHPDFPANKKYMAYIRSATADFKKLLWKHDQKLRAIQDLDRKLELGQSLASLRKLPSLRDNVFSVDVSELQDEVNQANREHVSFFMGRIREGQLRDLQDISVQLSRSYDQWMSDMAPEYMENPHFRLFHDQVGIHLLATSFSLAFTETKLQIRKKREKSELRDQQRSEAKLRAQSMTVDELLDLKLSQHNKELEELKKRLQRLEVNPKASASSSTPQQQQKTNQRSNVSDTNAARRGGRRRGGPQNRRGRGNGRGRSRRGRGRGQ